MEKPGAPALLYVWDDRFLWVSHSFKGAMTRRYATNLIVAITRQPFMLSLPGGRARPCAAAICAPGAQRSVDATEVPFLSLNLEPESQTGQHLESLVARRAVLPVERGLLSACDMAMVAMLEGRLDGAQEWQLCDRMVLALSGRSSRAERGLDPRVREVAEHLRNSLPSDIEAGPLAQRVNLSPTRLTHLFSDQVGLPMSRFLLWAKMRRAATMIQSGKTLTEIAHVCGFADSAHLTRTFRSFLRGKTFSLVRQPLCSSQTVLTLLGFAHWIRPTRDVQAFGHTVHLRKIK